MGDAPCAPTAADVIRALGLVPLPREGGFYRETYRSAASLPAEAVPPSHIDAQPPAAAAAFAASLPGAAARAPRSLQPGGSGGGVRLPGRSLATAIYYLITPETFSALHRLRGDEVFHHYSGDAVEMRLIEESGSARTILLGRDIVAGERPQVVVPAGVWQASRLRAGGAWALLGTTMAPGFDFADYEHGAREELCRRFPQHASWIRELATDG